jgi:hypothetical protein
VKGPAAASAAHAQFESSTYVFYGPQSGFNVSGPAIFCEGADLSSLGKEVVNGKIVVVRLDSVTSRKVGLFMPPSHPFSTAHRDATSWINIATLSRTLSFFVRVVLCQPEDAYEKLHAAGALAIVSLSPISPPGFNSYRHSDWDANKWRVYDMPLVECSYNSEDESTWGHVELELSIADPFIHPFQDAYESWLFILTYRILAPMFAFYTSWMAAYEVRRLHIIRHKRDAAGSTGKHADNLVYLICVIEAPSMLLVGLIMALGQFGSTLLPSIIHVAFSDLLTGAGTSTTLFLALHLREEVRFARELDAKRSIWDKHGIPLRIAAAIMALVSLSPLGTAFATTW